MPTFSMPCLSRSSKEGMTGCTKGLPSLSGHVVPKSFECWEEAFSTVDNIEGFELDIWVCIHAKEVGSLQTQTRTWYPDGESTTK